MDSKNRTYSWLKRITRVLLSCAICLISCKKDNRVPKEILPLEEMAELLTDIYVLAAKVEKLNVSPDSTKKVYDFLERELLKEYGISDSLYLESYNYYLNDLNRMTKIHDIVIDTLSLRGRLKEIK